MVEVPVNKIVILYIADTRIELGMAITIHNGKGHFACTWNWPKKKYNFVTAFKSVFQQIVYDSINWIIYFLFFNITLPNLP